MKLVHPISEQKKKELEQEIENQKQRLREATAASVEKIKKDLSAKEWIRNYPIQSAVLLTIGGFFAVQYLNSKRQNI